MNFDKYEISIKDIKQNYLHLYFRCLSVKTEWFPQFIADGYFGLFKKLNYIEKEHIKCLKKY